MQVFDRILLTARAALLLYVLRKRRRQRAERAAKDAAGDIEAQPVSRPASGVDSSGSGGPPQPTASSPPAAVPTPLTEGQRMWERFKTVCLPCRTSPTCCATLQILTTTRLGSLL